MGMTIDFTGKTVLVTGAAKGLGKDMALLFASCGANVHIGDFNKKIARSLRLLQVGDELLFL